MTELDLSETAVSVTHGQDDQQDQIDERNAAFWNELCGSGMARVLGITEISPETLRRFDAEFLRIYPYLPTYYRREPLAGKRVLEIGLGYGTLGQVLAARGCEYHGLDIAPNPVEMMRYRLTQIGINPDDHMRVGSVLDLPYGDCTFDYVYSIGCLHHTGDLPKAVSEVHRVLVPAGKTVIMLYNRKSYRQFAMRLKARLSSLRKMLPGDFETRLRANYDANAEGEPAPYTDYVSKKDVRRLFRSFSHLRIDVQNFDPMLRGRIPREALLNNVARVFGTDLYLVATK